MECECVSAHRGQARRSHHRGSRPLVGRLGRERHAALAAEVPDEFSREEVNGFAANVSEVESAVNRFRDAVNTVPMFGGKRLVWLKDVNLEAS